MTEVKDKTSSPKYHLNLPVPCVLTEAGVYEWDQTLISDKIGILIDVIGTGIEIKTKDLEFVDPEDLNSIDLLDLPGTKDNKDLEFSEFKRILQETPEVFQMGICIRRSAPGTILQDTRFVNKLTKLNPFLVAGFTEADKCFYKNIVFDNFDDDITTDSPGCNNFTNCNFKSVKLFAGDLILKNSKIDQMSHDSSSKITYEGCSPLHLSDNQIMVL